MRAGGIGSFAAELSRAQADADRAVAPILPTSGLPTSGVLSPSGMPRAASTPLMTAWMVMTPPGSAQQIIEEREDLAAKVSGWWMAGNGSLAVRLRGRGLRQQECGGVLLTEASAGAQVRLQLRNTLDRRVEVVVDWCGQDLFGQQGQPSGRRGVVLPPGGTVTLAEQPNAEGKAAPLQVTLLRDAEALKHHQPAAHPGVVRLTVFQSTDAVRNTPRFHHARPAGAVQRRAAPRERSYEYR